MENLLIYKLLVGKFVTIKKDKEIWSGIVSKLHKHIDGSIVLENAYNAVSEKYYPSVIMAKLCIPELGQGNYTTNITIDNTQIILKHKSVRSDEEVIEVVTILS